MAYCINPDCSQRENPDTSAVCQNCGTPLILQNRYRIRHLLRTDSSSYTEVFEIEDLVNRDKPKVLKSLKEVTPQLERLFEQEASILKTLRHPGLPIGEALFPLILNTGRQLCCFVMEKIPGEDLQIWLSHNQYVASYKTALDWLKQLTQILQFVHDQKFFHRDIKPTNIMLRPDGSLVLIDFGTARKMTQTIINAKPITVINSVGYTPPEQHEGHAVFQSDFYALGRTVIYLLTGIDPTGDRRQDLLNWSKYIQDPKTPKKFISLLQAMTDSHPQQRPPTAQAILKKIEKIEQHSQQWPKLLLSATCGVLLLFAGTSLYEITVPRTCDNILNDYLSCGEESLTPSSFWGNGQPPPAKQLGMEQYRNQNFAVAVNFLATAFQQEPDPETLIYLNNAKIHQQFPANQIYTIAVAVPLERRTDIGREILRGVAQAQTEALKKGQPLRIIIADDSNREDSKIGNNARKIAQHLVRYRDLLAVLGHYSSEATKNSLPIYRQAGVVLISATSTSQNLKDPFFFRTVPSDRLAAQKMVTYLLSELKQPQVAIFYSQGSEYAESLSQAVRESTKSLPLQVIDHQAAFNLASDGFNANTALNQAQNQGAKAIVLIPDAGVGLYNAIPNALKVIQFNLKQMGIVAGDSLYTSELLKSDKIISAPGIKNAAWAISWHPLNDINSAFVNEAQSLWKIPRESFLSNTDITWRTATSYDAILVLSQAITQKPTRQGMKKTLSQADFSVTGATGVIQFNGSDHQNGTITMVKVQPNCRNNGFVFIPSDRPLQCE